MHQNEKKLFQKALSNGQAASEAFDHSNRYLNGWMQHRDSSTGLIPRNLKESKDFWNAQDAAADNYPFMVLTSFFTNTQLFNTTMAEMLQTEERLTSRIGRCPASYSFIKKGFLDPVADTGNVIFGSAEYMKDGLLPLTEWLGVTPWSQRMIGILDDLHKITEVVSSIKGSYLGGVPSFEANGDLLQVLSRMYWMTGNDEYLQWAQKIGDYYLLGNQHPTLNSTYLRLRDHGCEMVLGLCELYATMHFKNPAKAEEYKKPLFTMLDCILEKARNEDGLFYNSFNPQNGEIIEQGLADTWGYILDGFYIVYKTDSITAYRDAVTKVLSNLQKYHDYPWEGLSSDGYADAIESAINLINREPNQGAEQWIDSEIKIMWAKQQPDGVIEGWHGDGNFARTSILYALWKTQGIHVSDWRKDVFVGSVEHDAKLYITLKTEKEYTGKLYFDKPRHKTNLHLPFDWTRINQFPEWFVVENSSFYTVIINGKPSEISGKNLIDGLDVLLKAGEEQYMIVSLSH